MGRIIGTILGAILAIWLAVMAAGGIFATLKTFLIIGLIAMAVFIVAWLVARRPVAASATENTAARTRGSVSAMTAVTGLADWRDLEQGAPELARLGLARLQAAGVALLGTVRPDGSPRISPIEPHLVRGQLLVGAMTWSKKAADLLRDPRYVLHSAVTGPDSGEGELKLHGSAVPASRGLRAAAAQAW
jgi:Pyridoxamine 5'-phosphate oxidase